MANNKGYKRSWKNYLLDPSYQLRFTLTMLAVAAGLMAPLGWWVSQKATTATEVALNQVDEIQCPEVLSATQEPRSSGAPVVPGAVDDVEDLLDEAGAAAAGGDEAGGATEDALGAAPEPGPEGDGPADDGTADDGAADDGTADDGAADDGASDRDEGAASEDSVATEGDEASGVRERPPIKVNIDDSAMPDPAEVVVVGEIRERPPTPEEIAASQVAHDACLAQTTARRESVLGRKSLITLVMVISGVILLLGLAVYGIKTTHRVAGPLFKVGLYLKKLENNVYDTVYNLRKGDQLVEFYDHFKAAHSGVQGMQEEDRDRLKDALALAKEADLASKSKELAECIAELERLLAEKEESLDQK